MKKLFLIAGPCVVENEEITFHIAEKLSEIKEKLKIDIIFKASYKKANRTSINSFIGIGDIKALEILAKVREKFNFKILTDVHAKEEVKLASDYVDILQIPAFLCRQTELLLETGNFNKIVNIKKGQWVSPDSMINAVEKIRQSGNVPEVWLTERGTAFGYNDLVVDFTSIPKMKKFADKVIIDCTHSVQKPNMGSVTGGDPSMIETLALCGIAAGVDALFIEVHPKPSEALSDASSMLQLAQLEILIEKCIKLKNTVNEISNH
jgi:2-dehydro-3-deoxyphosphooctonate aldolase (KDO 8-P synthase)